MVLSEIKLPDHFREFTVTDVLGWGSCGRVYKVADPTGSTCALKILPFTGETAEPEILKKLGGAPGIVNIRECYLEKGSGSDERSDTGTLYILMDDLTDLKSWCQEHPVTETQMILMMIDICAGLMACEKAGILHQDIKPDNILLSDDEHAVLADFGAARIVREEEEGKIRQGTFRYMAPEVYRGRSGDQRGDLYSLGMVFYILMNRGRDAFASQDKQILSRQDKEQAFKKRMQGGNLPAPCDASEGFAAILSKACAYDPRDRYQCAEDLKKDLSLLLKGRLPVRNHMFLGWSRKTKRLAGLVIVFAAVSLACMLWAFHPVFERMVCGPSAYATLYNNGTLVIFGKGAIDICQEEGKQGRLSGKILSENRIRRLVVKEGVTSVGFPMAEGNESSSLESLRSLSLPEGLVYLQPDAFRYCNNLTSVRIPDTVKEIGSNCFYGCSSLQKVTLPRGLTEIKDGTFCLCSSLDQINLPKTIGRVGINAFLKNGWIEKEKEKSPFILAGTVLVLWNGKEKRVEIPEDLGIESIGYNVFADNPGIEEVTIPESVKSIERLAFMNCSCLKKVTLPSGLTSIGDGAFSNCGQLEEIKLPDALEEIGDQAFSGCILLKTLNLPESVSRIGKGAFTGTPWLEQEMKDDYLIKNGILLSWQGSNSEVRIPEEAGICAIGPGAFANQKHITRVFIPEGVTLIGRGCFSQCQNLREISFPKSLLWIEGGSAAFEFTLWLTQQRKEKLYVTVNDILLEYVISENQEDPPVIPEKIDIPRNLPVTKIGDGCFRNCNNLKELIIPEQIEEISPEAFSYNPRSPASCRGLGKVHLSPAFSEKELWEIFKDTPWYYEQLDKGNNK